MVKILFTLLRWLGVDVLAERKRYEQLVLHAVPEEVRNIAEKLSPWVETFDDIPQSSDWKRKEVYALGIKAFPDAPKNIIAYALEYAIWRDK